MVIRLRLAMHGTKNDRIFHIVAINATKRRNAKPIETLGIFNARSPTGGFKSVEWNPSGIKRWLDNGAQPSDRVVRLLELGQLLPLDSKWHPAKRRTANLKVLGAEEHISLTSQRMAGARFDIPPQTPTENQPTSSTPQEMRKTAIRNSEELTSDISRLMRVMEV